VRFAPSLAAHFERSVVRQPLTSKDRFEPTIQMTLRGHSPNGQVWNKQIHLTPLSRTCHELSNELSNSN
jgi:hypothetical protein